MDMDMDMDMRGLSGHHGAEGQLHTYEAGVRLRCEMEEEWLMDDYVVILGSLNQDLSFEGCPRYIVVQTRHKYRRLVYGRASLTECSERTCRDRSQCYCCYSYSYSYSYCTTVLVSHAWIADSAWTVLCHAAEGRDRDIQKEFVDLA